MSTPVPQPSAFTLPAGVTLPPGAQSDYAWTESAQVPPTANSVLRTYTADGTHYDLVSIVLGTFTTTTGGSGRIIFVQVTDESDNLVMVVQVPALVNDSMESICMWSTTSSTAYSTTDVAGDVFQVAPFPWLLLLPGFSLSIAATNGVSGDKWRSSSMTVTHIPTAPIYDFENQGLVATPLVL